jgi:hypothetical protein
MQRRVIGADAEPTTDPDVIDGVTPQNAPSSSGP